MFQNERRCPSCEATIGARTVSARPMFATVMLGLALTGCPDKDEMETMGSEGSATSPTAPTSMGDTETSSVTEGEEESSTNPGTSALYGTVDPGTDTTGGSSSSGSESGNASDTDGMGSSSGTDGTTVGPSPLYGVAET